MNRRRTALGLKIIAGGLLLAFGFWTIPLAALIVICGLLVCLSGARDQPRWAIFGALTLLALSVSAFSQGQSQVGLPSALEREALWTVVSFHLFAAFLGSFLAYADATCRLITTFVLRPVFWALGAVVATIVVLRLGVSLDLVSWRTLEGVLAYSSLPFYLLMMAAVAMLAREVSRVASNPDPALDRPVEP